ncbi:MAG: 5-dehydro-2-deoxygluconokinase, partial [Alphaproteobacteria bacterium]
MRDPALDVICIGRSSVDLYGGQVGGRLEDMSGFAKYIGGSPTNISVGCARLGLKSALITRVGDEHMGRFIRETLDGEGVETSHVITDPARLTALVILGIRDSAQFPLIFYRENCADMAISEADIDPDFIASAKAVLVTGTHFSTDLVAGASFAAMRMAREAGRKVAFDIDYRPNLWALGGHADGESRFAESARVTAHLQTVLPHCDLIVGTEEEWHIAGGSTDTIAALQAARAITDATLVCKRGALGCVVFEGDIAGWQDGISSPVREIEVFNVLGAGDGFMAGFLSGWLRGEPAATCALYANICGALAVSRHGCAPSYPSQTELRHMIDTGSEEFALRKDRRLEQIHWATTRRRRHERLLAFAFDHRSQFVEMAAANGKTEADIDRFKLIALQAVTETAASHDGVGLLVDDRLGRSALHAASDHDIWIGRPIEQSGVFPMAFEEGPDLGSRLAEWPV